MKSRTLIAGAAVAVFVVGVVVGGGGSALLSEPGAEDSAAPSEFVAVAPTSTVASAEQTVVAPTTTTTTTSTSTIPSRTVEVAIGDGTREIVMSSFGWVIPDPELSGIPIGADESDLLPFAPANDGPFGVTIDAAFLVENEGAPWLSQEDGVPVIDRVDATGRCLNITIKLILRRSFVSCPTRVQSDQWGYAGRVDDAPAINITTTDAAGVLLEHNTVRCTGFDEEICGRSIRVGAPGSVIRFNDLAEARGAVELFDNTTFAFNHLHNLSFGFDPARAESPDDRVTHNNTVNNLGYRNVRVVGNFIEATYGRVSLEPETYVYPFFPDTYTNGIVELGDPINGFAFTNYLINGDGGGAVYSRNFVRGVGRPFLCNDSADHDVGICADDLSFNVFESLQLAGFDSSSPFRDSDGVGQLNGGCNFRLEAGAFSVLELPNESPGDDACADGLELSESGQAEFSAVLGATELRLR